MSQPIGLEYPSHVKIILNKFLKLFSVFKGKDSECGFVFIL